MNASAVVEALSAGVLIGLFLLQKYGTSRVSFLFSPIMGSWTLATPMIGVYSFLRHYPGIFKAVSPYYIVKFFLRNRWEGWKLLGGTVLCITGTNAETCISITRPFHELNFSLFCLRTGAEAMFADLGHFNKKSIQVLYQSF